MSQIEVNEVSNNNTDWLGFYSAAQVARLARIPRSTLYTWKAKDVIRPSLRVMDGDEIVDEGYSYADLIIIKIIRAIRDDKLNLRSACITLKHLIDRFGHPKRGLADTQVYIVNNYVYAEQSDQWQVTEASQNGQRVETRMFGDVFNVLGDRDEHGEISIVPQGFSSCVTISPKVMGGNPVIRDTRIPTSVIATKFRQGTSLERLSELFKPITRQCIEKAIEYEEYLDSPIAPVGEVAAGR